MINSHPNSIGSPGTFDINGTVYDLQKLTFSQIRIRFKTGRSYIISGSGRNRKCGYRLGCMTEIGNIEYSHWSQLIQYMIQRDNEQQLQENLLNWIKENCPWLHTQAEQKDYALQLHAARIFDCKEWVDYEKFNKLYRPEVLEDTAQVSDNIP